MTGIKTGPQPDALDLQWVCSSALRAAYPEFGQVGIEASFYPYIGLTHTIRKRGGRYVIRISDHCRNAPRVVVEAIAIILGSKILRRKPPREAVKIYDRFRREPAIEHMLDTRRSRQGRKRITEPEGSNYSLTEIFREVNERYFGGHVELRQIGWSARRSWGRLGHYDPVHNTVTISPVLDSPKVPRRVVAFVVYHELLHTLFEDRTPAGGRRHHPSEFRLAEKSHPDYRYATRFLTRFCQARDR